MAEHVGYDPSQFEFTTVHEEAGDQIVFDTIGDEYIGEYMGPEVIEFTNKKGEDESFTQLKFRDPHGVKVVNAGYELRKAFEKIEPGTITRVKYVKDVRISGQESPMKSFRVDEATRRESNSKR